MKSGFTQIDKMVLHMKALKPGRYSFGKLKADTIKEGWSVLHWYDKKHCYTFNEEYTVIRKDLINIK